jgi:hypothetical protein
MNVSEKLRKSFLATYQSSVDYFKKESRMIDMFKRQDKYVIDNILEQISTDEENVYYWEHSSYRIELKLLQSQYSELKELSIDESNKLTLNYINTALSQMEESDNYKAENLEKYLGLLERIIELNAKGAVLRTDELETAINSIIKHKEF